MLVICKQCLSSAYVTGDVHEGLRCPCCPQDHHHGRAAAECPRAHPGPCWQGPQSGPRPAGCTVCRPVKIIATAALIHAGG